jgi:hypothetical protein
MRLHACVCLAVCVCVSLFLCVIMCISAMCSVREYNCLIYDTSAKPHNRKINPLWAENIHPCGYLLLCGYTVVILCGYTTQ